MLTGDMNMINVRVVGSGGGGHFPEAIYLLIWLWTKGLREDGTKVFNWYSYSSVCHVATITSVEFVGNGYLLMKMDG